MVSIARLSVSLLAIRLKTYINFKKRKTSEEIEMKPVNDYLSHTIHNLYKLLM